MRFVIASFVVSMLASTASAQIMAVHFKEAKTAEKYRKHAVLFKGEYVVAGEAKLGGDLKINYETGQITIGRLNEFFVADPTNPAKLPYTMEGQERVPVKGKEAVLGIPQAEIQRISFYMRDETLAGLAAEYQLRMDAIAEAQKRRDVHGKTTRDWALHHRSVISGLERLRDWLASSLFQQAAKTLERKILAEAAAMKDDAVKQRLIQAQKSVRKAEVPEELTAVTATAKRKMKWIAGESQHCRIFVTGDRSNDAEVAALLKLAETCIEGWRREFVDPYLSDDFEDFIPEGLFIEWFFGPEEQSLSDVFLTDFYGRSIDHEKREILATKGSSLRFVRGVNYVHFWRTDTDSDLEGMVTHALGHALANIAFNHDGQAMPMEWLGEGAAYYMSFEYLGRNSVTCRDIRKRTYSTDPGAMGLKSVVEGQRAAFNELALSRGVPIDALSLKTLHEMDDADLAKSWSLFDYIARKEGLRGVLWLRSGCQNARTKSGFIDRWRADAQEIYDAKNKDPFRVLEDLWKAFARSGQKKDDSARRPPR